MWRGSPTRLYRLLIGLFALAGNRTYARVTQAEVDGVAHENDRSYLYTYDALSRLIDAQLGRLNAGNTSIDLDPNVALTRQLAWNLDNLGNWTGDLSGPGLLRDDYLNGVSPAVRTQDVSHAVDHANQLETVTVTENGGDPATQRIVHDAAGNLVWDGRLFYQYDGFNRLVQVNEASQLDPNFYPFINGKLYYYPDDPPPVGPTLATFIYDGLGRLIQTKRFDQQGHAQVEEYYYDGVRRILEIEVTDPNTPSAVTAYREYVYGPGYVDEVVCQIAGSAAVPAATYFYLQDGNYNVTAVIGPPDPNATTGPGTSPAVLWQYTYEPYGQLVFAECGTGVSPVVLPVNRIGHQGLFFERFCVDPNDSVTAPALLPDDPATGHKVVGLYNNRNRWYSPELGRFVQKDMNETAMPIITAAVASGNAIETLFGEFGAIAHYAGGMNLYEYQRSNPVARLDALGLDPFDDVDEILGDINAQKAAAAGAALAQVGMYFNTALMLGQMAFSFLPGADAVKLGVMLALGKQVTWDDVLYAGLSVGGGALVGQMAIKYGGKLMKYVGKRSALKLEKYGDELSGFVACNCFVGGTQVATPDGEVPIESIVPGDDVLTRDQNRPDGPVAPGRVTRVFRNLVPAVLWLTLANGQVLGTTPGHEVWTCENGWRHAEELRVGERFIDRDGAPLEIVDATLDQSPTVVYNLEVDGTFTYFAGGMWVHNNSCPLRKEIAGRTHGGLIHNGNGMRRALELEAMYGDSVRWNQALVGLDGRKLSNLRPDIQYIKDGKVWIEEYEVSHPRKDGERLFRELLGDAFGGYDTINP